MAVQGTGNFLSAKILATFDRALLMRATDTQVFDRFGMAKTIPANSNTKKSFAYRYKNILPATTPIAEYNGSNIKTGNKIIREEVEFGVQHYGDYITLTDELMKYDLRTIKTDFLDVLGDQASLTLDTIRRDVLRSGTNVVFADGATDRATVASGAKKITKADISLMAVKLKNQAGKKFKKVISGSTKIGTAPVRSAYIAIVHPSQVEDLRELAGWQDMEDYPDVSKALEDEVGRIGDFRVIESTNNDPIDEAGTNIYVGLWMAMDSYVTVSLRGNKTIQTIVHDVGSAGANDPLNQFGTVGWKAISGCAIVNQKWLIRTEATASVEDADVKHHYDFT